VVSKLPEKPRKWWWKAHTRDPETNSKFAPENGWKLEDVPFLLGKFAYFQVLLLLVSRSLNKTLHGDTGVDFS